MSDQTWSNLPDAILVPIWNGRQLLMGFGLNEFGDGGLGLPCFAPPSAVDIEQAGTLFAYERLGITVEQRIKVYYEMDDSLVLAVICTTIDDPDPHEVRSSWDWYDPATIKSQADNMVLDLMHESKNWRSWWCELRPYRRPRRSRSRPHVD